MLFLGDFASQRDQMVFAGRFYQPVKNLRTLNQEGKRLFAYLVGSGPFPLFLEFRLASRQGIRELLAQDLNRSGKLLPLRLGQVIEAELHNRRKELSRRGREAHPIF